jgi:hypothetical protein
MTIKLPSFHSLSCLWVSRLGVSGWDVSGWDVRNFVGGSTDRLARVSRGGPVLDLGRRKRVANMTSV